MFEIDVVCSDPRCEEEEFRVWVEDPSEVEAVVCGCGHSVVTLRVSTHEPELPVLLRRTRTREREPSVVC